MDYRDGEIAETRFELDFYNKSEFRIYKVAGNRDLIPKERTYRMRFLGFSDPGEIIADKNGERKKAMYKYDDFRNEVFIEAITLKAEEELSISFTTDMKLAANKVLDRCFERLDRVKIAIGLKERIYHMIKECPDESVMERLPAHEIDSDLYGEISEILLAKIG
jgi:hypothetical protein